MASRPGPPRKISDAHLQMLRQFAEVRSHIPTEKELARMTGLSIWTVKKYMAKFAKQAQAVA